MNHESMTVHSALCELKMLDKRIQKKIGETIFCNTNRHSSQKINGKTIDEFCQSTLESYQSIVDLIARRKAIRNALSLSNAKTIVKIDGQEYTVAEAIEMRKCGLDNEGRLLLAMEDYFTKCKNLMERENSQRLIDKADKYVRGLYDSKEKINTDDVTKVRDTYIAQNTIDFIDPLVIEEKINALSVHVDTFAASVDAALSVSNAVTMIEIDY